MANKVPSSCRPDKHLTQSHLQELYDDFNASLATARPTAFIFTSLVNNVRMAYKDALGEAREELLYESENYTRQLAELKLEHKEELELHKATKPAPPYDLQQAWHVAKDTFPLYIFSSIDYSYRRDWADWDGKEASSWKLRMKLKAFKFQEPGTVRIYALRRDLPARILLVRDKRGLDEGWKDLLEFWAYDKPRPETVRIWAGFRDDPKRGIIVKGNREGMEKWEEKCEFWVPV